ncbi:thioredoxin-like protein [Scenedesmus sp. NREL 46B-D3]|nr:thioredoxin-like protein [Scenedesmus sp. NREL 46B-D3]
MASLVKPATSTTEFDAAVAAGTKAVAFFWASWSAPCKHMAQVLETLAKQHAGITYLKVEAEEVDDVTERFGVTTVPHFVLLQCKGCSAGSSSTSTSTGFSTSSSSSPSTAAAVAPPPQHADVTTRIKSLLSSSPVVVFMKGNAAAPYCGFSRKVVDALRSVGVSSFKDVDIFLDEELRQALKEYSNWPTYPQLYVAGELIGGCDIVNEMMQSGELRQLLQEKAPAALQPAAPQQQKQGTPEAPRCGFSRKRRAVRQGLKQYSQWPTFPQVFVQGELLGGCDIVLEMKAAGELKLNVEEMMHRMQATA